MLTTVFFGTPELAVPALRALAARTRVVAVVTQPDRPAGRGRHLRAPPVKEAAVHLGLEVLQPEILAEAAMPDADLWVVLAYGEILRRRHLAQPRHGCINLHFSLLPRWRGASPMQAALRAGDRETGISVQRMVRRLDAGPVFLRRAIALPGDATLPWLHDRLAAEAAGVMAEFIDRWPWAEPEPQDEAQVTICRKLLHEDGHLDWTQGAEALERQVRAYTPAPGCWTRVGADAYRIHEVARRGPLGLTPGQVRQQGRELVVGCGCGENLAILRLQPPGRTAMDVAAFLNGHPIPLRFG